MSSIARTKYHLIFFDNSHRWNRLGSWYFELHYKIKMHVVSWEREFIEKAMKSDKFHGHNNNNFDKYINSSHLIC